MATPYIGVYATSYPEYVLSGGTTPPPAPTITSLSPTSGLAGSTLVITGTNFTGATLVSVNSGAVASFTVNSATQVTAVLTSAQSSGLVRVTTPGGTAVSAGSFTVTTNAPAPTITSFTPTSGPIGTSVTLTGTGFGASKGSSTLAINGVQISNITSWSATSVVCILPASATTGTFALTTSGGTATSAQPFTITAAPGQETLQAPTANQFFDSAYSVNEGSGHNRTSPFASVQYVVASGTTQLKLGTYSTYNSPNNGALLAYRVNGGALQGYYPASYNAFDEHLVTGLTGGDVVEFINSGQVLNPTWPNIGSGCFQYIKAVGIGTFLDPTAPTNAIPFYGNSIATGFNTGVFQRDSFISLLREHYRPAGLTRVRVEAAGARALHDDLSTQVYQQALNNTLAAHCTGTGKNVVVLAIGRNDVGIWHESDSVFRANYTSLVDGLHATLPTGTIILALTLFTSSDTANNVEAEAKRQAIRDIANARSWMVLHEGTALLTASNLDSDGVHPTTAGHLEIYQKLLPVLDGLLTTGPTTGFTGPGYVYRDSPFIRFSPTPVFDNWMESGAAPPITVNGTYILSNAGVTNAGYEIDFKGNNGLVGIWYFPLNGRATADVFLDGNPIGSFSQSSSDSATAERFTYLVNDTNFHTLRVAQTGGGQMLYDAFQVH